MVRRAHHRCALSTYHVLCPVCHHLVDETKTKSFRVLPKDIIMASRVNESEIVYKYDQGRSTHTIEIVGKKPKYHRHDETKDVAHRAHARLVHLRCLDLVHRLADGTKLDASRLFHVVNAVEPTFAPVDGTAVKSVDGPFVDSEGNWKRQQSKLASSSPSSVMKGLAALIRKLPCQVRCLISDIGCGRMFFIMDVADWMAQGNRGTARLRERFAVEKLPLTGTKIQLNLVHLGGRTYIQRFADVPAQQAEKKSKAVKGKPKTRKERKAAEQAALSAAQSKDNSENQVVFDLVDKKNSFFAVKTDGVGIVDVAFDETSLGPKWKLGHQTAPFDHWVSQVRNADLSELQVLTDCLKARAVFPSNRKGLEPFFDSPHRKSHYRDYLSSSVCDSVAIKDLRGLRAQRLNIIDPFPFITPARFMPMHAINDITIDWCSSRYAGMTGFRINTGPIDSSNAPKAFKVAHPGPDPEVETRKLTEDVFHTGTFDLECANIDFTKSGTVAPAASRRVKLVTYDPLEEGPGMHRLKFIQFEVGNVFYPILPHYADFRVSSEEIVDDVRGIWWSELPVSFLFRFGLLRGKNSE